MRIVRAVRVRLQRICITATFTHKHTKHEKMPARNLHLAPTQKQTEILCIYACNRRPESDEERDITGSAGLHAVAARTRPWVGAMLQRNTRYKYTNTHTETHKPTLADVSYEIIPHATQ